MPATLRLEVIRGDAQGREVLVPESGVTMGRSDKVEVQLPPRLVSRRHCRVWFRNGRWRVKDLGSRNGTFLNGTKVTEAEIRVGDVLKVGSNHLRVEEVVIEKVEEPAPQPKPAAKQESPPSSTRPKAPARMTRSKRAGDTAEEATVVGLAEDKTLEALEQALREIIEQVPSGSAFDAHYVLGRLQEENPDAYVRFAASYADDEHPAATAQRHVALLVEAFANRAEMIRKLPHPAYSRAPNGSDAPCPMWLRK